MNNFRLEPADILVNINNRNDPFSKIKRWVAGPYEHVFMYMGNLGIIAFKWQKRVMRFPMLFESNGRGVVIQSLSNRYGQEVVILRLRAENDRKKIPQVLIEAIKLASDSQSYYDYLCIVKFAIPRLICEKLRIPMPLKYHRDPWHICSEAVYEVFYRAKLTEILLPYCLPPLPGDFVTDSLLLWTPWRGQLSEEII